MPFYFLDCQQLSKIDDFFFCSFVIQPQKSFQYAIPKVKQLLIQVYNIMVEKMA